MRKLLFSALVLIGLCNVANAQNEGFRVGVSGGIPLSDASDFSSFNAGVDASISLTLQTSLPRVWLQAILPF